MGEYIGLDVSLKETAVSIRHSGKRIWRGKCASDPQALAKLIRKRAPDTERVVFETGPLSVWFYHELTALGLPAICIDARHAKATLDMAANKTDANDADGLAHLAGVGSFREVRVKGYLAASAQGIRVDGYRPDDRIRVAAEREQARQTAAPSNLAASTRTSNQARDANERVELRTDLAERFRRQSDAQNAKDPELRKAQSHMYRAPSRWRPNASPSIPQKGASSWRNARETSPRGSVAAKPSPRSKSRRSRINACVSWRRIRSCSERVPGDRTVRP